MTDSSCNRTEPNRITRLSFITKKRAGHPRKIYTSVLFDQEAPRIGRKNVYIRLVVYGSHNKKFGRIMNFYMGCKQPLPLPVSAQDSHRRRSQ